MSRWRPPRPPASPYITVTGYRALEAELAALWVRRHEVVVHLAAAAAEGDRSENAEYQYRKKELRGIDARVSYLQRRLPQLKPVGKAPADPGKVFFGASVVLEDEQGGEVHYRIVGSDEADAGSGQISVDSPLARQLMGKLLDDEVRLPLQAGTAVTYWLKDIQYPEVENP